MTSPKTIAITGASSGLGAALAREYAAPGIVLALAARRLDKLEEVAAACKKHGANTICRQVDVRQHKQIAAWIKQTEANSPIDLLIANAGIFSGHGKDGQLETALELTAQIETNLVGTATTANAVAKCMRTRKRGHIALLSSLAALQPLADAPGYSASKAGILAYGEALREFLIKDGITVSVILPGHIKTAQTAVHVGDLTGLISTRKAAAIIRKRLDRGQTFIAFPRSMHLLVRLGRLLPWQLRAKANRPFRFHVARPKTDQARADKVQMNEEGY